MAQFWRFTPRFQHENRPLLDGYRSANHVGVQLTGIIAALTATTPNVAPTAGDVVNGATVDTQFSSLLLDLGLKENSGDSEESGPKAKSDPPDVPDSSGVATLLLTLNTPPAQPVIPEVPRTFGFDIDTQVQPRADHQAVAPPEAPTAAPVQRQLAFELVIEPATQPDMVADTLPQSEAAAGGTQATDHTPLAEQPRVAAVDEPSSDKKLPHEPKAAAAVAQHRQAAASEEPGGSRVRVGPSAADRFSDQPALQPRSAAAPEAPETPPAAVEPRASVDSPEWASTAEQRTSPKVADYRQANAGSDVRDVPLDRHSPDRPIIRAERSTEALAAAPKPAATVPTRNADWRAVTGPPPLGPVEPELTTDPYGSAPRSEQRTNAVDTAPRAAAAQEPGGFIQPETRTSSRGSVPPAEQRSEAIALVPRSSYPEPAFEANQRAAARRWPNG